MVYYYLIMIFLSKLKIKSLLYLRYYAEVSGGVHLHGLAPGQHSYEERRSIGEPLPTLCPISLPGNQTFDLPHQ